MDGVTRIGVSLEPDLLKEFDEAISRKGYVSRSEAIRDLVRDSLAEKEWKNDELMMAGTIVIVYDQSIGMVMEKLAAVRQKNSDNISVTLHSNLGNDRSMEVIVVNGKLGLLKTISNEFVSVKGVLRGKLTMVSPSTYNMHHIGQRN